MDAQDASAEKKPRRSYPRTTPPAHKKIDLYIYPIFSLEDVEAIDQLRGAASRPAFVREATRSYIKAMRRLQIEEQLQQAILEQVTESVAS